MCEPTIDLERSILGDLTSGVLVAIDEVGRGALAGPVTVGAVAIDATCLTPPSGIRDSKALSERRRVALVPEIHAWARWVEVVHVPAARIDAVGITAALGEGAALAVAAIESRCSVGEILLDGRHDYVTPVDARWVVRTIVKGDATCTSIAAASIVAKCERDALMREMAVTFPGYGWESNVGYGTSVHRKAIKELGVTLEHRTSWNLG